MSGKSGVPDAWDDDWVNVADKTTPSLPQPPAKLTKAERRAQHAEQQKQLWDTAENPGRNLWLEAQGVVPLKNEFKPQLTLLSRKPVLAKRDPNSTLDDGEDSEEERRKKQEIEFEDRQRKAKIEREEKQRKYAEARERIMGSSNSGTPSTISRESSQGRDTRKHKSRINGNRRSQPDSSANVSPARAPADFQLFDPNDMGRRLPKSDGSSIAREEHPIRQPRGPSHSGKEGYGFSGRGGTSTA
nr:hypothetical protein CFP56_01006 [Quercus suber]